MMTAQFGETNAITPEEEIELKKEFLESGITGFDDMLGNGFAKGGVNLLCGHFGNGSDIFVQQVLNKRITSDEKVAYYTVEQSSTDVIGAMKLYGMNIEEYVKSKSWEFFRMMHDSMKNVSSVIPNVTTEQKIAYSDISPLLKHFQEKAEEGYNICINFSPLIRTLPINDVANFLFFMKNVARVSGGIHFILINEDEHKFSDVSRLKSMADTVFDFLSEIKGTDQVITLTVQKIKDVFPKTRMFRFVVKEKGLVTETIRRVK